MKIERVYVAGYREDVHLTRCCVASIRRWYPRIPISLVKDESRGPYDTLELEKYWDVEPFRTPRRRFGMGMGKLEVLVQPTGDRCLLLDSDIVFVGRVLEPLEAFDEDVVVDGHAGRPEDFARDYFDVDALVRLDPAFRFPGYTFNSGQLVVTCGSVTRADFAGLLTDTEPPRHLRPEVFATAAAEQGVLNYVLMKRHQEGRLRLRRHRFMWWAGWLPWRRVRLRRLDGDSPYPFLVHWAGPKSPLLWRLPNARLLRHFERAYYARIPGGAALRRRRAIARALAALRGA